MKEQDAFKTYSVIVKHEKKYSIWSTDRDLPNGWKSAGKHGEKTECLDYIRTVWTELLPLSVRKRRDEASKRSSVGVAEKAEPPGEAQMDRLADVEHRVTVDIGDEKSAEGLTLSRSFARVLTLILSGEVAVPQR